jgi:hypothetical protein
MACLTPCFSNYFEYLKPWSSGRVAHLASSFLAQQSSGRNVKGSILLRLWEGQVASNLRTHDMGTVKATNVYTSYFDLYIFADMNARDSDLHLDLLLLFT